MSRSLYSVILMDEVVREVDRLAMLQGTNRSNLINQILAEAVSYTTPEMRINTIFKTIEEQLYGNDMVTYIAPHQSTMSLKSSLEYRYRPTIKYEVELYRDRDEGGIGQLSVIFRTQSRELLTQMDRFFRLWSHIEKELRPSEDIRYALYDGRFLRSIQVDEGRNYTSQELADAISRYIKLFDNSMKAFLAGTRGEEDLRAALKAYLQESVLI
ncbi:MAG: hypothetical protein J6X30_04725 [Clostridia bacterium]|nr:hypothetical protein [Clostridia bacterium]